MIHLNVLDELCTNVIIIVSKKVILGLKYHVFYLGNEMKVFKWHRAIMKPEPASDSDLFKFIFGRSLLLAKQK